MRHNRFLQVLALWLLLFWTAMAIEPYDRHDWLLENLLVFAFAALLFLTRRRFRFSDVSYLLFTIFMTLHLIGAHYTYSETPVGFWLQNGFDLDRNHYDRVVHFSYGLLSAYPFRELLLRAARASAGWSCFLSVNMVLAFSAFFEVIEAIIAELVSPELGAAYLGIQGDIWDAQKDMFLAVAGAVIAMGVTGYRARRIG